MSKLRTQLDKTVDLLVEQLEKKHFAQQMPKVKGIVLVQMMSLLLLFTGPATLKKLVNEKKRKLP